MVVVEPLVDERRELVDDTGDGAVDGLGADARQIRSTACPRRFHGLAKYEARVFWMFGGEMLLEAA